MSVIITEVKTKKELRLFVKFPMNLYKDSPYYVPNLYFDEMNALDPAKNPMCKYSKFVRFLAWKDGKVVGRVAGIINEIATGTIKKSVSDGLTSWMTERSQKLFWKRLSNGENLME